MTDLDLTDADRKLLTEYLGECWNHDWIWIKKSESYGYDRCSKCGAAIYDEHQQKFFDYREDRRPFTTWSDLGAVKDKLVERGMWRDFYDYCTQVCDRMLRPPEFTDWLFTPARFCELAGAWLKEGKG